MPGDPEYMPAWADVIMDAVRVASRTAIVIALIVSFHGCYEAKRRYDIMERMQKIHLPEQSAPAESGDQ